MATGDNYSGVKWDEPYYEAGDIVDVEGQGLGMVVKSRLSDKDWFYEVRLDDPAMTALHEFSEYRLTLIRAGQSGHPHPQAKDGWREDDNEDDDFGASVPRDSYGIPLNQGKGKSFSLKPWSTPCQHFDKPYTIVGLSLEGLGKTSVFPASHHADTMRTKPIDLRVVLSAPRLPRGTMLANSNKVALPEAEEALLYVDWPDMGIVSATQAKLLVETIARHIRKGEAVEIGCHGGHGRTGTLLALLQVYAGMDGEDAIKHVRKHHCEKAIETKTQEECIKKFQSVLDGNDDESLQGALPIG